MAFGLIIPLRITQGIVALVVVTLSSCIAFWYDVKTRSALPVQFTLLIIQSLFSFISILYLELAPRYFPRVSHTFIHLAFETANLIFYFVCFASLMAFLGKLSFCRGPVCSTAHVDAIFAAIGWILWTGSTTMLTVEIFKSRFASREDELTLSKSMYEVRSESSA